MCLALHFPGSPSDFLTVSALQYKSPRVDTSNRHWQQFVERSRDKSYLAHPPRQLLQFRSYWFSWVQIQFAVWPWRREAMSLVELMMILNFVHADGQTVSSREIERLLSETKASLEWKEFRGLLKKLFAGVEHRKRRAEGNWKTFEFFENLALSTGVPSARQWSDVCIN